MSVYKDIPIHKRSDIVIDTYDIMEYLDIKEGPDLSRIWKELERDVIDLKVTNDEKELLLDVKTIYTKLVLKKEEINETKASS